MHESQERKKELSARIIMLQALQEKQASKIQQCKHNTVILNDLFMPVTTGKYPDSVIQIIKSSPDCYGIDYACDYLNNF